MRRCISLLKSLLIEINLIKKVITKKNWKPTSELVQHEQFTEGVCTRAIVRKSYVSGRYDPYYHEAHYITQQILTHL